MAIVLDSGAASVTVRKKKSVREEEASISGKDGRCESVGPSGVLPQIPERQSDRQGVGRERGNVGTGRSATSLESVLPTRAWVEGVGRGVEKARHR
jgi:hypothetical protein